jgi:hypothetical protein
MTNYNVKKEKIDGKYWVVAYEHEHVVEKIPFKKYEIQEKRDEEGWVIGTKKVKTNISFYRRRYKNKKTLRQNIIVDQTFNNDKQRYLRQEFDFSREGRGKTKGKISQAVVVIETTDKHGNKIRYEARSKQILNSYRRNKLKRDGERLPKSAPTNVKEAIRQAENNAFRRLAYDKNGVSDENEGKRLFIESGGGRIKRGVVNFSEYKVSAKT